MDQRTSVVLAGVLFAVVVAASVAYLIYGTPAVTTPTASPTPTPTEQAEGTPATFTFVSPSPSVMPTLLPLSATHDLPATKPTSVKATAKTGPEDWALAAMIMAPLLGAAGLVKFARS